MRRLICPFVVLVWHKQVFSWRGIFFCYSSWSRRRRAAIFERGTPWISYHFVFLKLNLNLPLICEESFEVTDHIQGILILKYLNSHFDMNRVVHKLFNPQLEGVLAIPTTIPDTPPFMIDTAYMAFFICVLMRISFAWTVRNNTAWRGREVFVKDDWKFLVYFL